MRMVLAAGWLMGAAGCSDYGLAHQGDLDGFGDPNPAAVEATQHTDRLLQVVPPVVDSLFVIDNSPSMVDDRRHLARAFPHFLEPFEAGGVDWHIGVVTTDMDDATQRGRLQARRGHRWLQPDTPAASVLFEHMATEGLGAGTSHERGREAAFTALEVEADGYNAGFLRDDPAAWLHITVLTDEDDDSDDLTISAGNFAAFVGWLRPYASRTTFNSVVALEDDGIEERGEAYLDLTARLGGSVQDLNDTDWPTFMAELGGLQAPSAMDEFFLSQRPVVGTVQVHEVLSSGVTVVYEAGSDFVWVAERNSVLFVVEPPALGSRVEITYALAAD